MVSIWLTFLKYCQTQSAGSIIEPALLNF